MNVPIKRKNGILREASSGRVHKKKSHRSSAAAAAEKKSRSEEEIELANNLPFAELRVATHVPKVTNDLAWSGRLQPYAHFWWKGFTSVTSCCLVVAVLSLGITLWSVFSRSPPLLIGVYPSGSELCFPEMVNRRGQLIRISPKYKNLCAALNARSGAMWVSDPTKVITDQAAVRSVKPFHYLTVDEAVASMPAVQPSALSGQSELPDGPNNGVSP